MERPDIRDKVDLIREAFAYIERFKGSTFVIKIANAVIDHPDFPQLARDLALLHKGGIRTVIVPGARERIDTVLDRFGAEPRFVDGVRVSPPEAMDLIKMAAFDVAHRAMTALSGHRVTAVIGNWVRARGRGVVSGVDFGRTGTVDRIRVEAVAASLDQGHVPIFPCVGHNDMGDPYNLSSDELARTLASALGAKKLFIVTAEDGYFAPAWKVPDGVNVLEDGRLFRIAVGRVQDVLNLNPGLPGREALETAAAACRAGTDRAHVIDGRVPGILLGEVFSNLGVGTMVFADAYERIRPMEAADVPGVLEIMRPLVKQGILIERTRGELERKRKDYVVYAMDGVVHGCAALHDWGSGAAEIAGLAVDPSYAQLGIGAKLVGRLGEKAAEDGFAKVFVLTTRTSDWFLGQGFREGSVEDLPPARREGYDTSRNSRVLVKQTED